MTTIPFTTPTGLINYPMATNYLRADPKSLWFTSTHEIIHILGSEGSVGLEKDTFNKIDSNNLEWKVEFVDEPLKLKKNGVWYIVPTKLTESIFKGCKR